MRNMPTTRASRLSAVRLSSKAEVNCSMAWLLASARTTRTPSGSAAATWARLSAPAGVAKRVSPSAVWPSRSMWLSRPTISSVSCAVLMSVSSRPSRARWLVLSEGRSSPTMITVLRVAPTRTVMLSPVFRPRAVAKLSLTRTAPGCARKRDRSPVAAASWVVR